MVLEAGGAVSDLKGERMVLRDRRHLRLQSRPAAAADRKAEEGRRF